MLAKVKKTAAKNNAHFNKYQFMKKGELFNQMPLPAAEGLVPRKAGLDTERYGGYNKPSVMFFIPVKYRVGKKSDIMVMSVELMHGKRFLEDESFAREYTKNRLNTILGKEIADYSFPLGMRPWKVNTMLSLDGFRVCISNSANKGRVLSLMTAVQFSAKPYWEHYMKKLEMFEEKNNRNPNYIYSEKYDIVSKKRNEELYDIYIDKLINSIYKKRLSSPLETLKKGRKKFCSLDIQTQTKTLLTIHRIFRRAPGGLNLKTIGGAENTGVQTISTNISNWKKTFTDVRIIDSSASGLWEKQSENLLTLL